VDKFEMGELTAAEVEQTEAELRGALQHVAAPEGFTDRVMARVHEREVGRALRAKQQSGFGGFVKRVERHAAVWTSIAAMLLLSAGGGVMYTRHQQEERRAAEVQRQMDFAMELTSHALENVQDGLDHSTAGQFLNGIK